MMAEFREVMKQWVRARKATASNLDGNVLSVYPLEDYDDRLIADIEKNVMQWAAEHPEPVYPTWEEWLITQGVIKENQNGGIGYPTPKLLEPIPADIAERRGIDPKAGGNP